MKIVCALGDNALLHPGDPLDVEVQRQHVKTAVTALAGLVSEHKVVVTHGSGPHVAFHAFESAAYGEVAAYPIDVLGAEREGVIGYLLEKELASELPEVRIATLLTQVVVDPASGAFRRPTKAVGPLYDQPTARQLAASRGWLMEPDGPGYRRMVASPEPLQILELETIRLLVDAGVVVICAGGGGIPVGIDRAGGIRGVEAVVDKDFAAALLAIQLEADRLLLLTDVGAVWTDWEGPEARPLALVHPTALRALALPVESMGPKAEAACRFAMATGRPASIGHLHDVAAIVAGDAGTTVTTGTTGLHWHNHPR